MLAESRIRNKRTEAARSNPESNGSVTPTNARVARITSFLHVGSRARHMARIEEIKCAHCHHLVSQAIGRSDDHART